MNGVVGGAALDLRHPRDADHFVAALIAHLADSGEQPRGAMTHRVVVDGVPQLGCSFAWSRPPEWIDFVAAGLAAATGERQLGLALGASTAGPPALVAAARYAADAGRSRRDGRAVVFDGSRELVGTMTVARILNESEIESVRELASGEADQAAEVDTRDFVRPVLREGRLELLVQPIAGGRLAPFEVPNPTPCCADHA